MLINNYKILTPLNDLVLTLLITVLVKCNSFKMGN